MVLTRARVLGSVRD
jgi:hypothetical protein